jgi:L-asparaginase
MAAADAAEGVAPSLSAQQLVDAVPGLSRLGVELEVITLRNVPGGSLTLGDLSELHALLAERFASGFAGAVVTQGTDTIEECAFVLGLWHDGPQPIVVTGAMRNPTLAGADGPANLLGAITVAADPGARELGCLVVLADEIHAAERVRKTHTSSIAAFASPNGGPVGYLAEGDVRLVNRPVQRRTLTPPAVGALPRIGLYTATLGDDGELLGGFADSCAGLVVAGFGVGHVPASWVAGLAAIAERIPVVLASRTGAGFTGRRTYRYPGSERDLAERGLIAAGGLDPYKARLLLQLLVAGGVDRAGIVRKFSEHQEGKA